MGVINLTPDSFSDGGKFNKIDSAIARAEEMIEAGADIIDIGGESTRPGSDRLSLEEEKSRVVPVLEELRKRFEIPLSLDSYKYEMAEIGCKAGVSYLNDVSMFSDPRFAELSGKYDVPIIIMHSQGDPKTMQDNPQYSQRGVFYDVNTSLIEKAREAISAGASEIILDPGIGFGKNLEHNLSLIRNIAELGGGKFRTLLGISRKSFIKKAVGTEDTDDRDIETMAIHAYTHGKADIIRVHNVRLHKRMLNMLNAIRP